MQDIDEQRAKIEELEIFDLDEDEVEVEQWNGRVLVEGWPCRGGDGVKSMKYE